MLRTILVVIYLFFFALFSVPALIVEHFIGKFNKDLHDRSSLKIVNGAFRTILFLCGTKVTVLGEENIPSDQAVLFIGNHRSYFDIVISYPHVKTLCGYIAKKEITKVPILKHWMEHLYCLFLDRKDLRQGMQIILSAIEYIKSGVSICVFPEGTRNRTEEIFLEPHAGSLKIADKTGCPIIPMAINNAGAIFEDHMPFIKKTHVVIEYGAPIYPNELSKEERRKLCDLTFDRIREMYLKNESLI